jgi:hypothetical protein
MFHKTKFSKTRSVEPRASNMSMFTQVRGNMMMDTEPGTAGPYMFHKNKFSNARTVMATELELAGKEKTSILLSSAMNNGGETGKRLSRQASVVGRGTWPETPTGGSRTSASYWTADSRVELIGGKGKGVYQVLW